MEIASDYKLYAWGLNFDPQHYMTALWLCLYYFGLSTLGVSSGLTVMYQISGPNTVPLTQLDKFCQ